MSCVNAIGKNVSSSNNYLHNGNRSFKQKYYGVYTDSDIVSFGVILYRIRMTKIYCSISQLSIFQIFWYEQEITLPSHYWFILYSECITLTCMLRIEPTCRSKSELLVILTFNLLMNPVKHNYALTLAIGYSMLMILYSRKVQSWCACNFWFLDFC